MDKIIESIGSNLVLVIGIVCFTIYMIWEPKEHPTKVEKYEELSLLPELLEKGVITQQEFDEKKGEFLN